MKKAILLLSSLLFAVTMATAQAVPQSHFAAPSASANSATSSQPASQQSDLRGCLSGTQGNYTVTDHQGKQHKVMGDNNQALWDDTGHEVDLSGKMVSGSNTFRESGITDISARCWNYKL